MSQLATPQVPFVSMWYSSRHTSRCGGAPSSVCEGDQHSVIFCCFFLHQSEHFAMEMGKQPIIFENPMYSSGDGTVKVVQPTQVRDHTALSSRRC